MLEVADFPYPELEDGAVLMRVTYSGVCGTDKHTYRGETKQYAGTPHERDLEYPLICGHENVGVVEAIGGREVRRQRRPRRCGQATASCPGANVPCGRCYYCLNDFPYYFCEDLEDYGNSLNCTTRAVPVRRLVGVHVLLPGTPIFRVPDELPDEVAVLTEVMSVTHGVDTARTLTACLGGTPFGESVAVARHRPARALPPDQGAAARLRQADRDRPLPVAAGARARSSARR